MDNKNNLAPHEILELRELMDSSLICAKKIQASMLMVKDKELKAFMGRCLNTKKDTITSIQAFAKVNLNMQ
jgi:hypothetical protein